MLDFLKDKRWIYTGATGGRVGPVGRIQHGQMMTSNEKRNSDGVRVRARRLGLVSIVLAAAAIAASIAAAAFFYEESEFSLAKMSWHRNFNQAMEKNNEVRLGDLVDFKWERIYFLESYDFLTPGQTADLFPLESHLDSVSWHGVRRYWTIAYKRPGKPPFLIKMVHKEWSPRNGTNLLTSDPDAKLRRVQKGTVESTWCSTAYDPDRCLALDDERSSAPTVKRH